VGRYDPRSPVRLPERDPTRRHPIVLALSIALPFALGACGSDGDGGPSATAVADAMVDRYGASPAQADCIARYAVEDYDPEELVVIVEAGIVGLPQARWERHLSAVVTCLTLPEASS